MCSPEGRSSGSPAIGSFALAYESININMHEAGVTVPTAD